MAGRADAMALLALTRALAHNLIEVRRLYADDVELIRGRTIEELAGITDPAICAARARADLGTVGDAFAGIRTYSLGSGAYNKCQLY